MSFASGADLTFKGFESKRLEAFSWEGLLFRESILLFNATSRPPPRLPF